MKPTRPMPLPTWKSAALAIALMTASGQAEETTTPTKEAPAAEKPAVVDAGIVAKPVKRADIIRNMSAVSAWMHKNRQQVKGGQFGDTHWTVATWYAGEYALYDVTKSPEHLKPLMAMAETTEWELGLRVLFADDQCIAQTYADLYMNVKKDPVLIDHMRYIADYMMRLPGDLSLENHHRVKLIGEWSWCDSLFMAPPAFAKLYQATGERKYLDFMNKKWWKTYDYLYDKEEKLFFRDSSYFDQKEANGKKVFWGRGNGWTMGGLVRVIDCLPKDYPDYPRYITLYKEMAERIAGLQQPDGLWRASLLDPDSYPSGETSASGFYCYALAWGINHGQLDKATYLPKVKKAWFALNAALHPDGQLGYAQPIGQDPKHCSFDDSEVYAVGAYLLAGREVLGLFAE
ncbi:MAG: glycoside hydrolase family 88 protein [Akkermansiaceae bacterium]|nr:glycoside hydrolase family 88 protein [Akkermansiaceae bacterium]